MKARRKHFIDTLCAMLGAGEPADPRQNARWRWLHATTVEWMDAQRRATAAWDKMMAEVSDDLSDEELEALELPEPPEEAEVNALWKQLDDVVQKDLWPRALYFGGI